MNARILPDGMMLIGRDVTGMGSPVQCSYCGKAYDLQGAPKGEPGYIELIHRYADCDLFVTPCCGKEADTREFVGLPSFRRLDYEGFPVQR
jgi:hypothetical protein